jgi:NAD(P)-dependent dehydrogenase (short-subunit alcohol dehydrogenase family)
LIHLVYRQTAMKYAQRLGRAAVFERQQSYDNFTARVFITGAADGLGQLAARRLSAQGHRVVLQARNQARAAQALVAVPGAEATVFGDLSSIDECTRIATQVNALGSRSTR